MLFGSSATAMIVESCRLGPRPKVLLPALFCVEVAQALEMAGIGYRCYDVPYDLSDASLEVRKAFDDDVGSIIVLHPFGLCRPFTGLGFAGDVVVIEDACHALRTSFFDSRIARGGGLAVFSFRKEFGWPDGGIACGPKAEALGSFVPDCRVVAERWQSADFAALSHAARIMTKLAAELLGKHLPPSTDAEVLTALPLISGDRDRCIARLRRNGILAWRWRGHLKGAGRKSTPAACALKQKLFLVPLPSGGLARRVLETVAKEPLLEWPQA